MYVLEIRLLFKTKPIIIPTRFCEIPWLLDILTLIPGIKRLNPMQDLEEYARNLIITRQSHSSEGFHDFMSYLVRQNL